MYPHHKQFSSLVVRTHTDHISRITHVRAHAHTRTRPQCGLDRQAQSDAAVRTHTFRSRTPSRPRRTEICARDQFARSAIRNTPERVFVCVGVGVCVLMYMLISYTYPQYRYTEFEALTHTHHGSAVLP